MNLRCTTAPFTVPREPKDFVVLCQLVLGDSAFYDVSVRQLTALPPASSRHSLAGLPLLLASSYRRSDRRVDHLDAGSPTGDFHPIDSCPCRAYTRACSGWPQNSGDDSKVLTTADAQAVSLLCLWVARFMRSCIFSMTKV
jgi:hypothetical protein